MQENTQAEISELHRKVRMKIARENMSPKFDMPVVKTQDRYLICSSLRSGSTLLSQYLHATGVAGVPFEYLNDANMQAYGERKGETIQDIGSYIQEIETLRTTSNGVFGMKAHFRQTVRMVRTQQLMKEFLKHFDKLIKISRHDKIAQAISLCRATQTGIWTSLHNNDEEEHSQFIYCSREIAKALSSLFDEDAGWEAAITESGLQALDISYEDLVSKPQDTINTVLQYLGLKEISIMPLKPLITKQADHINECYRSQFLAEIQGQKVGKLLCSKS